MNLQFCGSFGGQSVNQVELRLQAARQWQLLPGRWASGGVHSPFICLAAAAGSQPDGQRFYLTLCIVPSPAQCRLGYESAVLTLLELGADLSLGSKPALHALVEGAGSAQIQRGNVPGKDDYCWGGTIAEVLLQHGADCLSPMPTYSEYSDSLVGACFELADGDLEATYHEIALVCLAHLERQRAAGQLELGSADRAAQLLLAAALGNQRQLLAHGISSLEAHLAAAGGALTAQEADMQRHILNAAIDAGSTCSPASLEALLTSTLPFQLGGEHMRWAAGAQHSPAAKVQLLLQAGAPLPNSADLLDAIDRWSTPAGVAVLLSVSRPPVDTIQPSYSGSGYRCSYSCPIHRALRDDGVRWPAALRVQRRWWQHTVPAAGCAIDCWQALTAAAYP